MKSFIFFLLHLCFATIASAQPDLKKGVPIQYYLQVGTLPDGSTVDDHYYAGKASFHTPLYLPELRKVNGAFVDYAKDKRSVRNYLGPLGMGGPNSLGYGSFATALKGRSSGSFDRVGRMYYDISNLNETITSDGEIVFRNGKVFIENGKLKGPSDTVYTENISTNEMDAIVVENNMTYEENVVGIGFIEEWEYHRGKAQFIKDIKYIGCSKPKYDEQDESLKGLQFIMNFKAGKFNKRYLGDAGLVRKGVEYTVLFNRDFDKDCESSEGLAMVSESYGYIEPTDRFELLIQLAEGIKSGELSVYHYDPIDFDPDKLIKASADEFFKSQTTVDSFFVEDLASGEMILQKLTIQMEMVDVVGFRFIEDWYMDPVNFSIYKRVRGLVLLKVVRDEEDGSIRGVQPFAPFFIGFRTAM